MSEISGKEIDKILCVHCKEMDDHGGINLRTSCIYDASVSNSDDKSDPLSISSMIVPEHLSLLDFDSPPVSRYMFEPMIQSHAKEILHHHTFVH